MERELLLPGLLTDFLFRLPPGPHLTPGTRINTVVDFVAECAKDNGINITGLILDGTAPVGGHVERVLNWCIALGPIHESCYPEWYVQLRRLLVATGFKALDDVLTLGCELEEVGIRAGDPHTL